MEQVVKKVAIITAAGRQSFTEEQARRLEAVADVRFTKADGPLTEGELVRRLEGCDFAGLTPRSVPVIERRWLSRLPRLRGIAVFAAGVDYIDMEWLSRHGVAVSHLPDYSTESVAEHAIGMMLSMSRRIHLSEERVRGRVPAGTSILGFELRGRTIGVIGLGRIGGRVAELSRAFGMRVLGYDPWKSREGVAGVGMEELLASSDIVSLHFPAEWRGRAVLGRAELAAMKKKATLINVSRCALVDPQAVVESIAEGHLRGYAVDDIFPLAGRDERADRQIAEGRILQTGHTAWYSEEVLVRGYDTWIDNLCGFAAGKPRNLIPDGGVAVHGNG